MKYLQAKQRTRQNDYVIGRAIDSREKGRCSFHFRCVGNKIVFTTPEAPVHFVILRGFLTDLCD